jgi:hypothetical protein
MLVAWWLDEKDQFKKNLFGRMGKLKFNCIFEPINTYHSVGMV